MKMMATNVNITLRKPKEKNAIAVNSSQNYCIVRDREKSI